MLVDGTLNTLETLRSQDSGVMDVAHSEGVDLTAKIETARQEIEIEVEALLRVGGCGSTGQVVATRSLRRWHALLTLAMVYRDAFFSQLNDRYKERWKAYEWDARAACQRVLTEGVGMVRRPLGRPGLAQARLDEGTTPETTYWVRTAWVSAEGEESEASEGLCVAAEWPHRLRVEHPVGRVPEAATGWNVYVGYTPGSESMQNAGPMAIGESWTMPEAGLVAGAVPGEGQEAEYYCSRRRLMRRG